MNIFVTGTDTNVGKTVISAWICKNTKAKYWKPIQTGNDSDTLTVKSFSPNTQTIEELYKFANPLSPYDASNLENIKIDINKITEKITDKTVIEGAGGILVPICKNFQMLDLASNLNAKILIVAQSRLGLLNHIFMTVEILKDRGLDILGIIVNGKTDRFLVNTIEAFSKVEVLSIFIYGSELQIPVPQKITEILQ